MNEETALGHALWKGKRLTDMTREELYQAFEELGALYHQALQDNKN